jgi:hypothetical protein
MPDLCGPADPRYRGNPVTARARDAGPAAESDPKLLGRTLVMYFAFLPFFALLMFGSTFPKRGDNDPMFY